MTKPKIGDLRVAMGDSCYFIDRFNGTKWECVACCETKSHAQLFVKALKQSRRGKK